MALFAFPAALMPDGGTAPLASVAGIAGLLELVGGVFVFVGLFTRPVAFVLSGLMAAAYFMGHAGQGFWPVLNGGCGPVEHRRAAGKEERLGASTSQALTGAGPRGLER